MKKNRIGTSIIALVLITAIAAAVGCSASDGSKGTSGSTAKKEAKKEEKRGIDIKASIEEQVIAEKDGVKVTATGLGSDDEYSFYINIKAENDTENIYEMWTDRITVNGFCMMEGMNADDPIMPGETETRLLIGSRALKYMNMGEPGEIKIYNARLLESEEKTDETLLAQGVSEEMLEIMKEEGQKYYSPKEGQMENPFFASEEITIQTSAYDEMEVTLPDGEKLYDENGIQLIRTEADKEDKENGCCDIFFLKNDSSDVIFLSSKDSSVNDFMLEDLGIAVVYSPKVSPGETAVVIAAVDQYSLQYLMNTEEDVKIESLECTLVITKIIEMDEFGRTGEGIAEIPYTYTAE